MFQHKFLVFLTIYLILEAAGMTKEHMKRQQQVSQQDSGSIIRKHIKTLCLGWHLFAQDIKGD